jgi:hypothetical protein
VGESASTKSGLDRLAAIGQGLDRDQFPVVFDGGGVEPSSPSYPTYLPGERRSSDEPEGSRGSPARPGEWTAGGARPAGGSATPASAAAPLVRGELLSKGGRQIVEDVAGAYPQVSVRPTAHGFWITVTVQPVQGLPDAALIMTLYPNDARRRVSSWAWWTTGVWIGPRHTNYPDGSICAFEATDGTWSRRDSLVRLLDLNSVWVTRHLYLRFFGRWPGRQVLHTAFERLSEHRPTELCGCDSGTQYSNCCETRDSGQKLIDRYRDFLKVFPAPHRRPPDSVVRWLVDPQASDPELDQAAPFMASRHSA